MDKNLIKQKGRHFFKNFFLRNIDATCTNYLDPDYSAKTNMTIINFCCNVQQWISGINYTYYTYCKHNIA